jgi:predicted ABC-type ATPase
MRPSIYIIAGPNGVGKTTFAREFLPNYANCRNFINADLIAQGIARFRPRQRAFAPVNSCSLKLIFWHSAEPILVLKRRSQAEAT